MEYLGDKVYWFPNRETYDNYIAVGGYNGFPITGRIIRQWFSEIWAVIT